MRFSTVATAAALTLALPLVSPIGTAAPAQQRDRPPGCTEVDGFSKLDFWVGEWEVFVGDQQVGTNRIEKILDGCAILEHWRDARGSEGRSIFYYLPADDVWKQVWVTPFATVPGGVKEKTLVETLDDGSLRFQGTIRTSDGGSYLDCTTLVPNDDGTVRQLIEVDRGEGWRAGFDATYRRLTNGASSDQD